MRAKQYETERQKKEGERGFNDVELFLPHPFVLKRSYTARDIQEKRRRNDCESTSNDLSDTHCKNPTIQSDLLALDMFI